MFLEEDNKFITMMWKQYQCNILPISLSISDRLFKKNGYVKTYAIYIVIHLLYLCGIKQRTLLYMLRMIK